MILYSIETIINFIFILLIPLLLLLFSLFALWQILRAGKPVSRQKQELLDLLSGLPEGGQGNDNIKLRLNYLRDLLAQVSDQKLALALEDLAWQSQSQHQDYWLHDPQRHINQEQLLSRYENSVLDGLYSRILILLGIVATAAAAFTLFFVPREDFSTAAAILLISIFTAAALSYLVNLVSGLIKKRTDRDLALMNKSLEEEFTAFTEETGIARLSARMFEYEQTIKDNLTEFENTASKLVEGEFAAGINSSVRSIMNDEIAPPIIKAADTLNLLAHELTARQESGMAELATQFSSAVVGSLEKHLEPVNEQLGKLNHLIGKTEEYVSVSVETLETSREQNIQLNKEISEALRLMTMAKNDLANEMLEIRDYLEEIGDSTNKLARLYQGEDRSLSLHISNLSNQLNVLSDRLNNSITESSTAIELAADMTKKQEEYSAELLARLDEQVENLGAINQTIRKNTTHFTAESAQLVSKTLAEYDASLGEVVERLSFVVAEIRDAIDGLPYALRVSTDR